MGFTKLDERILQSSIMAESAVTFKIWITLLAACESNGIAYVSAVYLSSICHLPLKSVEVSLERLENPDPHSRSLADEGRRIRRIDGGYEIINYSVYRDASLRDAEAERKRIYRQAHKGCPDTSGRCPDSSASASASASASDKELVDLLIAKIVENDPKAKVPPKDSPLYLKWVKEIRLCREADGRTEQEIATAILFSQQSDFWKPNILSTATLRKKLPTLLLQASREGKSEHKPSMIGATPKKDKDPAYWAEVRRLKAEGIEGEALTEAMAKRRVEAAKGEA